MNTLHQACLQQVAASLQDSSLAVMLRRYDQLRNAYENHPEYQFRSDIYMAYHDSHIEEYRMKRDEILNDEVTDAAGESSKIPRLQNALQEFDQNFDVIGLVNFNWGHTVNNHSILMTVISESVTFHKARAPT